MSARNGARPGAWALPPAAGGLAAALTVTLLLPSLSGLPGAAPVTVRLQAQAGEAGDSAVLREEARTAQARFEAYRESRIPPTLVDGAGRCDDMVGRLCFRFERDDDPLPAEEPPEVSLARADLLRTLATVGSRIPGDPWVLGQRVFYAVEAGSSQQAEALVRRCDGGEPWWCDALLGLVLHRRGETLRAREAFDRALGSMPPEEAERWRDPSLLLDGDARAAFRSASGPERDALLERLWLLADPLFLVPGNDRRTEHLARRTLARIRQGAANPFGLEWEEDLEELLLRYGAEVGWERHRSLPSAGSLRDTRHVVGRHQPRSRDFLPPGPVLARPASVPPGEWIPERARPRNGYAPGYAPELDALDQQVARFRRGDSLLVAAAYRRPQEAPPRAATRPRLSDNPFAGPEMFPGDPPPGDAGQEPGLESGLFLAPLGGGPLLEVRGASGEGRAALLVPNGEYVASLEVWSPERRRAWRARGGLSQADLVSGVAAVSDLVVLEGGGALPESLEEALPRMLPAVRLRPGQRFVLAWEVYGLRVGESATVAMGFDRERPGVLRRAGEFLRLLEPAEPVVLSWEEAGPDRLGTVFRAVEVELPSLEPGSYTLLLDIGLPGREPLSASRVVEIGAAGP